jgi:hypothetical protein
MARVPRRWVKIFCYEALHGSVSYQLSEAEQSVWVKLLCLAGLCGNEGVIADHDLRPFPHDFIIHELHTTEATFESTIKKCKEEGRVSEDGRGIVITNWTKYQSEYDRQKPYRQKDPHLFVGADRAQQLVAGNEVHIKAWEDAHPGKVHPNRQEVEV